MNKIKFITEIAEAHIREIFKDLKYLTEEHLKLSSHYLKYQIFKTKNLIRRNSSLFNHYKKIELLI